MKKRICVVTDNPYLWQKIYLILKRDYEVLRGETVTGGLCLVDTDTAPLTEADGRVIRMSRGSECELSVPFSEDRLRAAIENVGIKAARLTLRERTASLDGEEIRLTEVEAALLSRLMRDGGGFVSRESLLRDVWGGTADGGIVNVYIHYLREKLERRGEKIIISSRSHGYKIDEKYLQGGAQGA